MTSVFLDTGYVLALEAADDQYHDTASQHWRRTAGDLPPLVTTSYVFDEVVTFFNSRKRNAKAVEVGNRLLQSPRAQFVPFGLRGMAIAGHGISSVRCQATLA